jgi:hypothetical protein
MKTPMNSFIAYLESVISINEGSKDERVSAYSQALAMAKIYAEYELMMMRECFDAGYKHGVDKNMANVNMFPEFDKFIKKYE